MKIFVTLCLLLLCITVFSQKKGESIVAHVDELTIQWDKEAVKLITYNGLEEYCKIKPYRDNTVDLLTQIHHYDSLLYKIVNEKYDVSKDKEAQATLDDIKALEEEYTTKSFLKFLHKECGGYNFIESNLSSPDFKKEYKKEVARLEKELDKYVTGITKQIDLIDEHVHHLKNLE